MFRLIGLIIKIVPKIIHAFIFKINKMSKHMDKYSDEERYEVIQKVAQKVNEGIGYELDIEGLENIPNKASLFVCNHMSLYDPVVFIDKIKKPTAFICKQEVEKYPIVGKAVKVIGGNFLHRDDMKQQLRVMLAIQKDLEENKRNWFIFPEGKRIKDPLSNIDEFHHGTFRPALKAGAPIVPCVLYGTHRLLQTKNTYKKYHVAVKFLKPVTSDEYAGMTTQQLAEYVRNIIQKELSYNVRKSNNEKMSLYNKNFNPYQIY